MKRTILILTIMFLLGLSLSYAVPDNGIMYYDFEEGAGDLTDEWFNKEATNTGAAFSTSTPNFAVSGDGGSYSTWTAAGDSFNGTLTIPRNFSLSAWYNTSTVGTKRLFDNANMDIGWAATINVFSVYITDSATKTPCLASPGVTGCAGDNDGAWHHVFVRVKGDDAVCEIWCDGVFYNRTNGVASTGNYGTKFEIAAVGGVASWEGLIDELKIYDTWISNDSIKNIYETGSKDVASIEYANIDIIDNVNSGTLIFNSPDYFDVLIPMYSTINETDLDIVGGIGYCYQETANVSNGCGDLSTGGYSNVCSNPDNYCIRAYDGNYATHHQDTDSIDDFMYFNYTKPANVLNTSLWQTKDSDGTRNSTIPIVCFNQSILQLRAFADVDPGDGYWGCYNGTGYTNIFTGGTWIYEEAMFWAMYPENITIDVNGVQIFKKNGIFNASNPINNININNNSVLQDCVDVCLNKIGSRCECEVEVNSVTAGKFNYTYNVTTFSYRAAYTSALFEGDSAQYGFKLHRNESAYTYSDVVLWYNNTKYNTTLTYDFSGYGYNYTYITTVPVYASPENNLNFYWNYTKNFVNGTAINYTTQQFYQTIAKLAISECGGTYNITTLTLHGFGEEDNLTKDYNLNLDLNVWTLSEGSNVNFSFIFNGSNNYSLCISNSTGGDTFNYNAIMEYYASGYENRKYYINNAVFDFVEDHVFLYLLNTSVSSDIIFSLFDETGTKIKGAYINILRYYPGEGVYRTVEIEKTDDNGQTLGKMRLADVFYKFIVSYEGAVKLDTEVQKMLSTTKTLILNLQEDVLESWNLIDDVYTSVTCTESTATCRFSWSDPSNIVEFARLQVYQVNSFNQVLLSSQELASPSGTLVYVIPGNTTGLRYIAQGYIETTTENSFYPVGLDEIEYIQSLSDKFGGEKAGLWFPFLLLLLSLSAVFMIPGPLAAVGVIIGSVIAILGGFWIGLIAISWLSLISLLLLAVLFIYKLSGK